MIDEEIRDALKVEPSPEFLARVRTRIASEPAPSAWRWSWTFAAAGALAAAVIVAVVWSPIESGPGPLGPGSQAKPSAGAAGLAEARGARGRAEAEGPALQGAEPVRRPGPFGPGRTVESRDAASLAKARGARGARGRAEAEGPALHEKSVVAARQPEILVDAGEMRALQRLIAAARNDSIALTPVTEAAPPAPMELEPVTDIVIAPITIDPIAPLPGAEGVRP